MPLRSRHSTNKQLGQSSFWIEETATRWQCVPAARKLRSMLFAGIIAWPLFRGVIILLPMLVVTDPSLRLGAIAFSVFAVVLVSAFFAGVGALFWKHQHTPLVADKKLGSLLYGNKHLCDLTDIYGFEANEIRSDDTAGGEDAFLFEVRLKNGKAVALPVWFASGTESEAEAALAPLAKFVSVEFHIDKRQ